MSSNRFFLVPNASSMTVPEEYKPSDAGMESFSDSSRLLQEFTSQLKALGYEQITASNENSFLQNLRRQLERLNSYTFQNSEWSRFLEVILNIAGTKNDFKFQFLSGTPIKFVRENGATRSLKLVSRSNFSNNQIQFLVQAEKNVGVLFFVNGLPAVFVELFPDATPLSSVFGILPKIDVDAFKNLNQMLDFVQIFVLSNGRKTRYATATARRARDFGRSLVWADASGKQITNLFDFTRLFLSQNSLQNILFNFQTQDWERETILLRSSQIAASERILNRIVQFTSHKGNHVVPGGFVRQASGSGKTLTAFRTAQLVSNLSGVEKVLFVVDRNDLDWQAVRFYEHYKKHSIDFESDFQTLQLDLNHPQTVFIPTSIQKLEAYMRTKRDFETVKKRTVFVYDECQGRLTPNLRSLISRIFVNSQHFFFTCETELEVPASFTGPELHSYSLKQAISERAILPFHIQYIPTQKTVHYEGVPEIDALKVRRALIAPDRIRQIALTIGGKLGSPSGNSPFSSILAVNDAVLAMNYYVELRRIFKESDRKVKIAAIYGPTESEPTGLLQEESFDASQLGRRQRDFLELVIEDYNAQFNTNLSSVRERFSEYFLDLSRRMQHGEIDLLIVVNRFLSSFGSANLNTLWVDREFTPNALLQAFSRTNRLNAQKKAGNVVCFRDLSHLVSEVLPPETLI